MRNKVFVRLPIDWQGYVDEKYNKFFGKPFLLRMALYGYAYAGKFLWEEQANFLRKEGFIYC
jgi:hypothetical protein